MKALKLLAITTLAAASVACSDAEPNFDIELYDKQNSFNGQPYAEVVITARADEVVIEDVIFNRGNCETRYQNVLTNQDVLPVTLRFGERAGVQSKIGCTASEIEIVSSEGAWVYEY